MMRLSRAEARNLDRTAIEQLGIPGIVLMENAGRGCAEWLMQLNPERRPVSILCGPGNNGGDGFVMARHLEFHGWPVEVLLLADPRLYTGDAAINWSIVQAMGLPISPYRLPDVDNWLVDAVFGTGLSRPVSEPIASWFKELNSRKLPVLAVDLPSGLDCDTGEILGVCLRARCTTTFVAEKVGFANPAAREYLGDVQVIPIGIPRQLIPRGDA
jgi:NAD(P)H-hydrate epimerase